MNDVAPLLIGTPAGLWPAWLRPWLGLDAAASDVPAAGARFLIAVEHPALGLAAALAGSEVVDPAQWMAGWAGGARELLRHVQRHAAHSMVIDAEEAARAPQAFAAVCAERLGLGPSGAPAALPVPAGALPRALAEALVAASPEVPALFAELQASCIPLGDAEAPWTPPRWSDRLDAGPAAAQELQQLAAAATRLPALQQALRDSAAAHRDADQQLHQVQEALETVFAARREAEQQLERSRVEVAQSAERVTSLHRELGELRQQLQAATQARAQAERQTAEQAAALGRERDTARLDAAAQRQENELLLLQLHQVQEELETVFVARRDADAQLASTRQQFVQADEGLQASRRRADESVQRVAQLEQALSDAQARQRTLATERDADRAAAQQENELLLLQLHQVQEELETYYLQCRELQAAAARATPLPSVVALSIGEVEPVFERDTPPHRELTLTLRQLRAGAREVAEATVRLVEHQGHPGLVVFGNASGAPLFAAWRETGREDGRPYALLVPSDEAARPLFDAFDSADWLLLLALVARIEQRLQDPPAPLAPHWRDLARRLGEELHELPARFRHGALRVESVPDAPPGTLALHIAQVHCGVRQLPQLTLRWHRSPAAIVLLAGADGTVPPLPSWPLDAQGKPQPALALPLVPSDPAAREAWHRLPVNDRAFVLALLAALPRALAEGSEAADLPAQALRMLAPLPSSERGSSLLRRAARRVLRPPSPLPPPAN